MMKQITDEQADTNLADAVRTGITQAEDNLPAAVEPPEMLEAKDLARRYRLPFVNLCRRTATLRSIIHCSQKFPST
jgi:hypothetical protein